MKKCMVFCSLVVLLFSSCTKQVSAIKETLGKSPVAYNDFIQYTIGQGKQYCDQNVYTSTVYTEQKFVVKFDSSAVYQSLSPSNQVDINKLFGFSDNNGQHHQFSARFGWRWSNNALRLFAYVYNEGIVASKEIGTVAIGAENNCAIKVAGNQYIFTLNDRTETMPRKSPTPEAAGYKLYPYFGGNELAPHPISIWIKEIK